VSLVAINRTFYKLGIKSDFRGVRNKEVK
jgi:hypothetical protein